MHMSVSEGAATLPRMACAATSEPDSLAARIARHAERAPDRTAVRDGTRSIGYGELNRRADRLAAHLREAGAGPGQCVGLLLERSAEFVVAALAALKSGSAYLPLDPGTPAERAAFILADADACVLLTHRGKARTLDAGACRVIELDSAEAGEIARREGDPSSLPLTSPEDLAYVIYTSGSTGRPKGVEITHANLLNLVDWHVSAFGVTADDRASHVAGLGFDAAGWEIWPALSAGASLHVADDATRRSPHRLRDWLVAERVTIAFVPTLLAEQLLHTTWPAGTALRTLLTGADTLHRRPPAGLPFALVNNYGPTECTVVATSGVVSPTAAVDGPPSIGRPIANATALILDESLRPVPAGQPGELCLAGALVGRGYRNNPAMTASRFVTYQPESGPPMRVYRTGDRVRLLETGEIAFLGRLDDQVKIRGYRIELGEIVACLDRHPAVEASAVVVRDDAEAGGPALVAYVVAAGGSKATAADLRDHLAARLPDYMIPARFVAVRELPLTPNGKLDKSALPAPSPDNLLPSGTTAAEAAPAASHGNDAAGLEGRVEKLVAGLLGRPSVGREDNFFMLGGHSMLGAQLVARIRDTFNVKLTLRQLFTAPTIAMLSAEIARLTSAAGTNGR